MAIWLCLAVVGFVLSVLGPLDPLKTGELLWDLFLGCLALALWAKRSARTWTAADYGWRLLVCLVVATVGLTLLRTTRHAADATASISVLPGWVVTTNS